LNTKYTKIHEGEEQVLQKRQSLSLE